MFCSNCGAKLEEGTKFCNDCGANNGNEGVKEVVKVSGEDKLLFFATIAIALINAVIPFLKWVQMPAVNTISTWLGGSSKVASLTLFEYIFSGASDSIFTTIVMLILALVAFISVILNVIYCVKALKGKPKSTKYGTSGSILLLIMALLFWVIMGLISVILKFVELTSVVYFAIVLAIINIVLLKKLKKRQKNY